MAKRTADRIRESRLLQALYQRFELWMYRNGLMAFVADPAAPAASAAPAAAPADAPAADPAAAPAAAAAAAHAVAAPVAAPPADPSKPDATAADPAADPAKAGEDGKGGKTGDDGKPAGAPESYSDFTLPENVKLNESVMGEFQQLAKEHGLTQEAAQKFVDLGAKMQAGNAEAIQAAIEQQGTEWGQAAMADKEIGGEKFQENVAVAKAALDKFGTPELKAMLVQSKLGNHPEVLRTFFRVGQAISQDGFAPGRQGVSSDPARVMFPSMN